jgi:hypothetical protein
VLVLELSLLPMIAQTISQLEAGVTFTTEGEARLD